MSLPRSERNSIIEDFRNGIINPEYEVKATKTKGRYTVKKRKVPLTDEQLEQLSGGQSSDKADVDTSEPKMKLPPMKRSKKENALFELQNQLNSQMLSQITELTNKVAKLKAWKKAVKRDMYEDVEERPQVEQQVESQVMPQVEQRMESQMMPLTSSELRQVEQQVEQQGEPQPEQPTQPGYMSQIPEQYMQQYDEPQYDEPQYDQQQSIYRRTTRSTIDYSKFGF